LPGQGPERGPLRLLGIDLLRALGQGPVRWLLRRKGRVLLRVQEQPPAQALVQVREQRSRRGPGKRPGQGPAQ